MPSGRLFELPKPTVYVMMSLFFFYTRSKYLAVSKEAIAMASGEHLWAGPACCNNELLRKQIRARSILRHLHAGDVYLSPGDPIHYVAYVADGVTSHYMFGSNGR